MASKASLYVHYLYLLGGNFDGHLHRFTEAFTHVQIHRLYALDVNISHHLKKHIHLKTTPITCEVILSILVKVIFKTSIVNIHKKAWLFNTIIHLSVLRIFALKIKAKIFDTLWKTYHTVSLITKCSFYNKNVVCIGKKNSLSQQLIMTRVPLSLEREYSEGVDRQWTKMKKKQTKSSNFVSSWFNFSSS